MEKFKRDQAGYILESPTKYQYIIQNNEITNSSRYNFEQAFTRTYEIQEFEKLGIPSEQVTHLITPNIESTTKILGKDSASNYTYLP
ncbi:hypothetical protein [Garciella nitratireducens]|uniref:hypothetical protein n=1 Tax=Garciella nitratireducens TaxID=218205 RepID=UPI000DE961F4|nr:hypothetical protein [Garciella nitratireducens]RBP44799.1 hypothetical protein DFR81_104123 [Garciella nitratireducens]